MASNLEDEFGDILQKARDGKSWSQKDLSRATGIPVQGIDRMESYEMIPSDLVIQKLADALNLHCPSLVNIAKDTWQPRPQKLNDLDVDIFCLEVLMGLYPVKCYLLRCKSSGAGLIIDTGGDPNAVIRKARECGIAPQKILLTHAHPDHAGGLDQLVREFNCPVYIDKKEPKPGGGRDWRFVEGGESLDLGSQRIKVLSTPGHTRGGVTYQVNGNVISGDIIFAGSMGRANSSWDKLFNSVTRKILCLPDETVILPGHGPATTVGEEKKHNPFFCGKV